jgi:NADH-quinone oxidoreductase subunit N
LLAYSSIAHMGYFLLGLSTDTADGFSAALFYMITYVLMSLAAFGLLTSLSQKGMEVSTLDDIKGLNSRNPWIAFLMLLVMFSMAGIPPLVGFMAKVGILEVLIDVHHVSLAVIAIIFSIIGVYYYIRVVKVMYFDEPATQTPMPMNIEGSVCFTLSGLMVLLLGLFPGGLFMLCHQLF